MPRTPRNPGSGKPPHNGPAMGQDYGAGWGGPAKGEGKHGADAGRPEGVTNGKRATLAELCAPHTPDVVEVWLEVMRDANAPAAARIAAADKIAERAEGKTASTNINVNVDDVSKLSDAELAAELARLRGAGSEGAPGAGEAESGE